MIIPGITASPVQATGFVRYVDHETNSASSGDTVTVNVPSTTGANFLLACGFMDDSTNNFVTPTGWTSLSNPSCLVTAEMRVWYRTVNSEPASYDFEVVNTGTHRAFCIVSVGNVDTADPFDDYESGGDCSSGTTYSPTTPLSVTETGVSIFSFCGIEDVKTLTDPAGYTEAFNIAQGANGCQFGMSYDENVSTGSHDPEWSVATSSEGLTVAVALNYSAT